MEYLTSASVILTDKCNMNCTYCYEANKQITCEPMTKEFGKEIVEFLIGQARMGNTNKISITYFGGEPTLNVDVMSSIFDYAVTRTERENMNLEIYLITNGTTPLSGEYFDFIKKWRDSKIPVQIQLSLDGTPEANDKNRLMPDGSGSSSIVEKNIKSYKSCFGENFVNSLSIHSTISLESLPYLFDSYKYFVETLGIPNITFMPVHEENWMTTRGDKQLYNDQLMDISDYIIKKTKETNDYTLVNCFNITSKCNETSKDKPCGAGVNFCAIDSKGDIYPCHRFRSADLTTKIGNIFDDIDKINQNRLPYLEYHSDNMIGKYSCADCDNSGCYKCIAANYQYNENMLFCFPKHCEMQLVNQKINRYINSILRKDESSYDKNENSEIKEFANALNNVVIPMKEFMDDINKKVDSLMDMNAVLINMVKFLLEKEKE